MLNTSQQNKPTETDMLCVINAHDAVEESAKALYGMASLFKSILAATENHTEAHRLAGVGRVFADVTADMLSSRHEDLSAVIVQLNSVRGGV